MLKQSETANRLQTMQVRTPDRAYGFPVKGCGRKACASSCAASAFRAETTSRSTAAPPKHLRSPFGCGWIVFLGFDPMAIQLLVAKVLRDELSLRGMQSLSVEDSEAIAARIFERITELELELAARGFNIPASGDDRPT